MSVASILSIKGARVITIHPHAFVREAVALLAHHGIGALVVEDVTEKPVGIVTERHIIRRLAGDAGVVARTVGEIMTGELVAGTPTDELAAVAHTMTERRIRHLPIIEGNVLVGIVSMGDVLRAADTLEMRILAADAV